MPNRIGYLILIIYIALTFWAVMMWIDKMSKVIIWSYLAWITCFSFGNLINQWVIWLSAHADSVFLWISYENLWKILWNSELILILLLFAWLVRLVYSCWRIQISFGSNTTTEKLYFIILIPITVLSLIAGPYVALMADGISILWELENWLRTTFWFLWSLVNHLPLRLFVNGIVFIIISSHINFKISLSAKATKLPEWL